MLLAAAVLGPKGPADANLLALGDAVSALKRVGLDAEARRVGFEALYARMPSKERPEPMAKKRATDSELALFLDMLIAERGAAAHTIEAYTRDLAAFLAFLAARARRPRPRPAIRSAPSLPA